MKPTLIITGSSGLIGRRLVEMLSNQYDILGLDIARRGSNKCRHIRIDLGDSDSIEMFFASLDRPIAGLINLASYYDFDNTDSVHYHRMIEASPHLLLGFLEHRDSASAPFIQAGSLASLQYPSGGEKLTPDSTRSDGPWVYARFKNECLDHLIKIAGEENIVELILAGVYSKYCQLPPVFHLIEMHRTKQLGHRIFAGDINGGLCYVHLDDACQAFKAALENNVPGGSYLVGEPEKITHKEMFRILEAYIEGSSDKIQIPLLLGKIGLKITNIFKRKFFQPWMLDYADAKFDLDISKTETVLGWVPRHRIADEMPKIIEYAISETDNWILINKMNRWHSRHWRRTYGH